MSQIEVANRLAEVVKFYASADRGDDYSYGDDGKSWVQKELVRRGLGLGEDASWQEQEEAQKKLILDEATRRIGEVALYAASVGVPFSIEMAVALLEPMADQTYWRSSSYGC